MKEFFKKMKSRNMNDKAIKILTIILICCYIGSFCYGIYRVNYPNGGINGPGTGMAAKQARLVVIQSVGAMLVALSPYLLLKMFNVKVSFSINLMVQLFTFCGIFLGEACLFYHRFAFWDKVLHSISGVGVAMVGFAITANFLKNTNVKYKVGVSFAVAFIFGLSGGMIHELYEFTIDTLFGTNMQKAVPFSWTGGSIWLPIPEDILTDEQLIEWFRSPEGYRYALMDTMYDLVCDFSGSLLFCIFGFVGSKNKNIHKYEQLIQFNYLKEDKQENLQTE